MQSLVVKCGGFCVLPSALCGEGNMLLECFTVIVLLGDGKNEILTCYVGLLSMLNKFVPAKYNVVKYLSLKIHVCRIVELKL